MILDKFKLDGKKAVVTGGTKGLGKAEDIAGAAVYLASAASDFVHGATLTVDGGWLAN